jgi:hypothetical protein
MNFWCWHEWSKWKTYQFVGTSYGGPGYLITGDTSPRKISETRQEVARALAVGERIFGQIKASMDTSETGKTITI